MKKDRDYEMPIGNLRRVKDFLPPPSALAVPENTVKITLSLNKNSVDFFKHEANKYHTKYQKMIRELVDRYASNYKTA